MSGVFPETKPFSRAHIPVEQKDIQKNYTKFEGKKKKKKGIWDMLLLAPLQGCSQARSIKGDVSSQTNNLKTDAVSLKTLNLTG